ncbi:MAG: lipopolysaccharide biosynthesis protein, partial [Bacteroidales bacterium]|nr:lipopolysaccharide biosynthesis protein [Bacteroidales bacterium]
TMLVTYFLTASISNIYILLATRIVTAATLYLLMLYCIHAQILKECIGYIRQKKKAANNG